MARIPALVLALPAVVAAQTTTPACAAQPEFRELDFWLGEWDVYSGGDLVGRNVIAKVLNGCAVTELWTDVGGGEGRSLFYYVPGARQWRQVWVTGAALAPGGVKEKRLIERVGSGVRFQGEITAASGARYLDRTTLTPNADGTVRQLIEISRDQGVTWTPTFDGTYRRRKQ
jgi:hypothetical protein